MIRLTELFSTFNKETDPRDQRLLTEAAIDSRRIIPGGLFFALKGDRVDGHDYVPMAISKGAQMAIIDREINTHIPVVDIESLSSIKANELPQEPFALKVVDTEKALQNIAMHHRKTVGAKVIGITGSVGKSSTKELVAEVLSERYHTHKNPGNYNNEIGLPLTLINCGYGHECIALEMGFYYPGEIRFLCNIAQPEIGIITNVGTVHAERAGSQEAIAEGKSELVQELPAHGTAILNYDDPYVRPMQQKTNANVLFYGLSPKADLWADDIQGMGLKGLRFTIHYQGNQYSVQAPILGRHSVQTILRACAAGLAVGMQWEEILSGLQKGHSQLRLVAVRANCGALILDDTYNATPESMIASLDLLRELKGNKVAVLGDMLELGEYEEQGHQQVGEHAAAIADQLITVGQLGTIIAESASKAGLDEASIITVKDSTEAAQILQYHLSADDIVLIKGSHGLRMDKIAATLEQSI